MGKDGLTRSEGSTSLSRNGNNLEDRITHIVREILALLTRVLCEGSRGGRKLRMGWDDVIGTLAFYVTHSG